MNGHRLDFRGVLWPYFVELKIIGNPFYWHQMIYERPPQKYSLDHVLVATVQDMRHLLGMHLSQVLVALAERIHRLHRQSSLAELACAGFDMGHHRRQKIVGYDAFHVLRPLVLTGVLMLLLHHLLLLLLVSLQRLSQPRVLQRLCCSHTTAGIHRQQSVHK